MDERRDRTGAMGPEVRRLRELINETKGVVVRKATVKNAVIHEEC